VTEQLTVELRSDAGKNSSHNYSACRRRFTMQLLVIAAVLLFSAAVQACSMVQAARFDSL